MAFARVWPSPAYGERTQWESPYGPSCPSGFRLRSWKPNDPLCPPDMQPETIDRSPHQGTHSPHQCTHLPCAGGTVGTCLPAYWVNGKDFPRVEELLDDCPGDAPMPPPGLWAWSGILVGWAVGCKAKYQQQDPNGHQFLGNWILHLSGWQLLPTTYPNTGRPAGAFSGRSHCT